MQSSALVCLCVIMCVDWFMLWHAVKCTNVPLCLLWCLSDWFMSYGMQSSALMCLCVCMCVGQNPAMTSTWGPMVTSDLKVLDG